VFFVFLTFYFDFDTYPVPIEQARWRLFHVRFKSHFRLAGEYSINCLIRGMVVVVFDVVEFPCDTTGFGRRRHAKKRHMSSLTKHMQRALACKSIGPSIYLPSSEAKTARQLNIRSHHLQLQSTCTLNKGTTRSPSSTRQRQLYPHLKRSIHLFPPFKQLLAKETTHHLIG
jgi:hypothetical protein